MRPTLGTALPRACFRPARQARISHTIDSATKWRQTIAHGFSRGKRTSPIPRSPGRGGRTRTSSGFNPIRKPLQKTPSCCSGGSGCRWRGRTAGPAEAMTLRVQRSRPAAAFRRSETAATRLLQRSPFGVVGFLGTVSMGFTRGYSWVAPSGLVGSNRFRQSPTG